MYFKFIKSIKRMALLIDLIQSQLIEFNLRLEDLEASNAPIKKNQELNEIENS